MKEALKGLEGEAGGREEMAMVVEEGRVEAEKLMGEIG